MSSPTSTMELFAQARAGDARALDQLFAAHFPRLRRWASRRLPGWARETVDTDDIVQDALLRTLRNLDHFEVRGPGALYAYLRQAVLNRISDELRRATSRPETVPLDDLRLAPGPSPLELAIGREALARYEAALARLHPAEQESIIGRFELGCSYEELAADADRPTPEAARKAVHRALLKLIAEMDRLASG